MTPDTTSRSRRTITLAGLGAVMVIVAVLAAVTWFFGNPAGGPNPPAVTAGQSLPSSAAATAPAPARSAPGGPTPTRSVPAGSKQPPSAPAGSTPIAVPPGVNGVSVADLAGSWDSTLGVTVTFRGDGTWTTVGGCNSGTGRWRVGSAGGLSVTVTSRTRLLCPLTAGSDGVPAGDVMLGYLQSVSRVTLATMSGRPALVLIDRNSGDLTWLVRRLPTASASAAGRPPGLAG